MGRGVRVSQDLEIGERPITPSSGFVPSIDSGILEVGYLFDITNEFETPIPKFPNFLTKFPNFVTWRPRKRFEIRSIYPSKECFEIRRIPPSARYEVPYEFLQALGESFRT